MPLAKKVLDIRGQDVPVSFTKTGRLDKKSQEAVNAALQSRIGERIASQIRVDPIELLTFLGLTVSYRYSLVNWVFDIMNVFSTSVELPELITDPDEATALLQHVGFSPSNAILLSASVIGMEVNLVSRIASKALGSERQKLLDQETDLRTKLEEAESMLAEIDSAWIVWIPYGHTPVPGQTWKLINGDIHIKSPMPDPKPSMQYPTDAARDSARDQQLELIRKIKADLTIVGNALIEQAAIERKAVSAARDQLQWLRWFLAMGAAGITILIAKEISTSEIAGSLSELMPL